MAKILMIDDDPDVVLAMQIPLEAAGYEFYSAGSGAEGLEKLKEINPDLIILDVMMETATEGFHTSLTYGSVTKESIYKYAKALLKRRYYMVTKIFLK